MIKKQAVIPPEGDLYKLNPVRGRPPVSDGTATAASGRLASNGVKKKRKKIILSVAGVLGVLLILYILFLSPSANFPTGKFITIGEGMNVAVAGDYLAEQSIIRHPFLFRLFVQLFSRKGVIAGDYLFKKPFNVFSIARRLAIGQFDIEEVKIVIQEGMNNREIAALLKKKLPLFDDKHFLELTADKEGMLFPDTYFIKLSAKEGMVAELMVNNFNAKIKTLSADIQKSAKTLNEILTMASIIEEETRTAESRRIVSGILWKRIKLGMPLQVDAVFPYIMNKYSLQLTVKDLQYDSPYNTYKYKGLPPGPISNPSLDAIDAALHPKDSPYLYYLSDRAGNLHYAKTYTGHKNNIATYLRN
ncbi:MAG: endolytic transglycosylase MltG [Patescibacteria group bacterium]